MDMLFGILIFEIYFFNVFTSGCARSLLRHAGFSSCSSQAELLHGFWDLPGPGIKPMSPALAGGFLSIAPPGMPWNINFLPKILKELKLLRNIKT